MVPSDLEVREYTPNDKDVLVVRDSSTENSEWAEY